MEPQTFSDLRLMAPLAMTSREISPISTLRTPSSPPPLSVERKAKRPMTNRQARTQITLQ